MMGRGGDGNMALRQGQTNAWPLQMRWWLTLHGYDPEIYNGMLNHNTGGLGLYSSSFPYGGKWVIQDYPWETRARIFATAMNPETGALSPVPVESAMIIRKLTDPHCEEFTDGLCSKCARGFVLQRGRECRQCAPHCDTCDIEGAGHCDSGG